MTISTQQIQAVLRTYNKQLKLSGFSAHKKSTPPQSRRDEVTISAAGKRKQVYQETAGHIVEKLTHNEKSLSAETHQEEK